MGGERKLRRRPDNPQPRLHASTETSYRTSNRSTHRCTSVDDLVVCTTWRRAVGDAFPLSLPAPAVDDLRSCSPGLVAAVRSSPRHCMTLAGSRVC